MSTDFMPGQMVTAVRDTRSAFSSDIDSGTRCVVKNPDYDGGMHSVAEAGYTLSVYRVGDDPGNTLLVKPSDFTPAPLDPTKVKAGDTVTLSENNDEGARIKGAVSHIERYAEEENAPSNLYFRVGGFLVGVGGESYQYTLTDHQPAPKPEWMPGTLADATITYDDGVQHDVRVARTDMNRGVVMWAELENKTGHGVWHTDEHVSNVRPLTVIVPDETRPALVPPTRAQIFDILYPDGIIPAEDQKNSKIDALRALFGGESR